MDTWEHAPVTATSMYIHKATIKRRKTSRGREQEREAGREGGVLGMKWSRPSSMNA